VLQLALLRVQWPLALLSSPLGAEVLDESGDVVFRGLSAKVGLYKGDIARIIPHRSTGRADYFGPPVNRAARFLSAAAPGQVLADRALVEEAVRTWGAQGEVRICHLEGWHLSRGHFCACLQGRQRCCLDGLTRGLFL
jgi:class 3 adenylate cyclase